MLEQNNLSTLDHDFLGIYTIRRYANNIKEKYISFLATQPWTFKAELEFYKVFKDEYSASDYLFQLRHFSERRNLVKFKTESTRKLGNFNSQWTKTLYQNNLKNIAFFFYIFKALKP